MSSAAPAPAPDCTMPCCLEIRAARAARAVLDTLEAARAEPISTPTSPASSITEVLSTPPQTAEEEMRRFETLWEEDGDPIFYHEALERMERAAALRQGLRGAQGALGPEDCVPASPEDPRKGDAFNPECIARLRARFELSSLSDSEDSSADHSVVQIPPAAVPEVGPAVAPLRIGLASSSSDEVMEVSDVNTDISSLLIDSETSGDEGVSMRVVSHQ